MFEKAVADVMNYVKQEVERVGYGRVIIDLNATSDKIDVITERRQRFQKIPKAGMVVEKRTGEFHNG